jgi:hypothetical protein
MIATLTKAAADKRLDEKLKLYTGVLRQNSVRRTSG